MTAPLTDAQVSDLDAALDGAIARAAQEADRQISELLAEGWELSELCLVLDDTSIAVVLTCAFAFLAPDPTPLLEPPAPGHVHAVRISASCLSISAKGHKYGGTHG